MRLIVCWTIALAVAACGSTAVGGYRSPGGDSGGSGGGGGSGGSGGSGGTGGTGGTGGGGGTGGMCFDGKRPALFLDPEPSGSARVQVIGRVVEHRDLDPAERPSGAFGVDRLLTIEPEGMAPEIPTHRLFYAVPSPELLPQVEVGNTVSLDYLLFRPFGESHGAVLRAGGLRLLWAAEVGGFGPLGTGSPELELSPGEELCALIGNCGTTHLHRLMVTVGDGPAVTVGTGETVTVYEGDREGRFYLGSYLRRDGDLCPDIPVEEAFYVVSLPPPPGCGPAVGRGCGQTEYCEFVGNECGRDGEVGACAVRPDVCLHNFDGVCGCDGILYWNLCKAQAAGTDAGSGCEAPRETFACGPKFCGSYTEYCQVTASDVAGLPPEYRCLPLPVECHANAIPHCDCLAGVPCAETCTSPGPELTVTCPGG